VTGLIIADLISDGASRTVDISAFLPERFMKKAGRRGRKNQGVEVGEQW
jgi:hypothetical protein